MNFEKHTVRNDVKRQKTTVIQQPSSANELSVWMFDRIDRNGPFAFDIKRKDFDAEFFMEKMIAYSQMTWDAIYKQTHDKSRSKHHILSFNSLSKQAQERFLQVFPGDDTDHIFSFALNNKLRIIGLRDGKFFHVFWYDPEHSVCPSHKK